MTLTEAVATKDLKPGDRVVWFDGLIDTNTVVSITEQQGWPPRFRVEWANGYVSDRVLGSHSHLVTRADKGNTK